ncbi:MAG TPA: methyltransferase domain-containing protein [bacterium]|jgi:SAM-dependent methyltransferase
MTRSLQDTPWYHSWFGSDYLLLYQHRSAQEALQTVSWLIGNLKLRPPCRILDLACGSGRHSAELARRGFDVVGLDLSWPLLRAAGRFDSGKKLKRIRGDMRLLPLRDERFELALSLFTSFGYFASVDEDARTLKEVYRVLSPGGIFVLDFLNAPLVRSEIVPQEEVNLGEIRVTIHRWVDEAENRVKKQIELCDGGQQRQYIESVYLYGRDDLADMFDRAGFMLQAEFGNYEGAPYGDASPRLIMVGTKSA